MKVTRLKRGYRINLTDSEFEVLSHMVDLASEDIVSDPDGATSVLSPAAKRAIRRGRIGNSITGLAVDEDRRT